MGVKWVAVPNRNTRSPERKKLEKRGWFKKAQAWRTGCEGRISVVKRRHGLRRCLYRGVEGMKRWVGLGVLADNQHRQGTGGGSCLMRTEALGSLPRSSSDKPPLPRRPFAIQKGQRRSKRSILRRK
jgi:hypothetical protein